MGTTPRRTQELGSFAYTCVILVGATFWSWAMAVPRALAKATMRMLDTFEDAMLTILWDYQGENILRFLYEHQQSSSANRGDGDGTVARVCIDGKMLCAKVAGCSRSVAMQTDDCAMSLGVREREKRNKLMDKILEDLVPALLQVLHSIPQRSEMEAMYREQIALIQTVQQGACDGPLLLVNGNDDEHRAPASAGHADIGQALQGLTERVGAVDERVVQVLQALESEARSSTLVDARLGVLVEGLGAVREKCEADRALALHMMQCLERIDGTIASAIAAAESKALGVPEHPQLDGDAQATPPTQHGADCGAYPDAISPSLAYSGRDAVSSHACSARYNSDDDYDSACARSAIVDDDASCASNTRAQSRAASTRDDGAGGASTPNPVHLKMIAADPASSQMSKRETSDVTLPRAMSTTAEDLLWPTSNEQSDKPRVGLGLSASKDDADSPRAQTTGRVRRKFSLRREIKRHSWFGKKPE
ncbi:hypothetical protein LPJ81_003811 [Coemansia sp. IMI 209127]|nr:hypothetical protein LPJ81_003811 [Coemansia sp. IMI 209127]